MNRALPRGGGDQSGGRYVHLSASGGAGNSGRGAEQDGLKDLGGAGDLVGDGLVKGEESSLIPLLLACMDE